MPASARKSPLIAVIEIGTFWMFSAFFCAVTTISSTWRGGASSARATPAAAKATRHTTKTAWATVLGGISIQAERPGVHEPRWIDVVLHGLEDLPSNAAKRRAVRIKLAELDLHRADVAHALDHGVAKRHRSANRRRVLRDRLELAALALVGDEGEAPRVRPASPVEDRLDAEAVAEREVVARLEDAV